MAESPSAGWSLCTPKIFTMLEPAKCVLIAGCGGGYDVLSGLPLYFALKDKGKEVHLASLSFTSLHLKLKDKEFCDSCFTVSTKSKVRGEGYFPELYLSEWFMENLKEDVEIFSFDRDCGVEKLAIAYNKICTSYSVDAIVLVDGGTDSVMFGYEEAMGTPVEDQTSIMAVHAVNKVPVKIMSCLGFGIDSFHGVSHGLFLENVATLEKSGGYLGSFSLSQHTKEGQLYMEAYEAVSKKMQPSIVCSSIIDSMKGNFGNHHSTQRTRGSTLFINPLMAMYWTFDLSAVVAQIPYSQELLKTKSYSDVSRVIGKHHEKAKTDEKIRRPIALPM